VDVDVRERRFAVDQFSARSTTPTASMFGVQTVTSSVNNSPSFSMASSSGEMKVSMTRRKVAPGDISHEYSDPGQQRAMRRDLLLGGGELLVESAPDWCIDARRSVRPSRRQRWRRRRGAGRSFLIPWSPCASSCSASSLPRLCAIPPATIIVRRRVRRRTISMTISCLSLIGYNTVCSPSRPE